jgi:DNA polymerase III sliding clamp (beta) subunit (PCNA family)
MKYFKEKLMKLAIKRSILFEALEKGSVAALAELNQVESGGLYFLAKSIKITVDKKFTIESMNNLISTRYSIDATEDNGIKVFEEGSVIIQEKGFMDWVKAQGKKAIINITLQKLQKPEVINLMGDDNSSDKDSFIVSKIGSIKMLSKDADSKSSSKWEIDCYDASKVKPIELSPKAEKIFNLPAGEFEHITDGLFFAALPKDRDHVLDSVSIQTYKNDLCFATTDTHRCALYRLSGDKVKNIKPNTPLLLQCLLLETAIKVLDKERETLFYYDETENRVFLIQPNVFIRLTSLEKKSINKFPNVNMLIEKDYKILTEVNRQSFIKILEAAAIVNHKSALFSFTKDETAVIVKTVSEDSKYKPNASQTQITKATETVKAVWGVKHLIGIMKAMKSENVELYIPENLKSVKITGNDDIGFLYFSMIIKNSKYDVEQTPPTK